MILNAAVINGRAHQISLQIPDENQAIRKKKKKNHTQKKPEMGHRKREVLG